MSPYFPSLAGGLLLGLSAVALLLLNGRVLGVSGIFGRLLQGNRWLENLTFVIGLALGPVAYAALHGSWPPMTIVATGPVTIIAGLLVGFGTRMGSGCTSGHGIMGLARFSRRSIAATATFLSVGILVATLVGFFR